MQSKPATQVGVIGDVHAEHENLERAIDYLLGLGVTRILCTGDLVDGDGDVDACVELLAKHDVMTVAGNHDRWVLQNKARHIPKAHHRHHLSQASIDFLHELPRQIEVETAAGRLLLCHGMGDNDLRKVWPGTERMPIERSTELDSLIADQRYRFVINGHVHFKTLMHFETLTLMNAGTISGKYFRGFSMIDFDARQVHAFTFHEDEIKPGKVTPLERPPHREPWKDTQCFQGNWDPLLLFHRP